MIKKYWFIVINDWITNHLGKNPKKGGSPAKDKKDVRKKNFKIIEWENMLNIWLIKNILNWLNINTSLIDIKE